jgi:hypothetical protein
VVRERGRRRRLGCYLGYTGTRSLLSAGIPTQTSISIIGKYASSLERWVRLPHRGLCRPPEI